MDRILANTDEYIQRFGLKTSFLQPKEEISVSPYKGIALGICLIPLNTYCIDQLEAVRYTHLTLVVPFSNVIFILFLFTICNQVAVKIWRHSLLSQLDLITII